MKQAWYTRKWIVVVLHIVFWTVLFSLPYLLNTSDSEKKPIHKEVGSPRNGFYFGVIMDFSWIAFFYLNALVLIPRFVYKKRYLQYSVLQLLALGSLLLEAALLLNLFFGGNFFTARLMLFNFFIYLFMFALSSAYQLIHDKVMNDKLASEKENENLKTELFFLRSQVSPHFMFNVLNNMVALARKHSDQLEPSLIKLSSLMRYMLYEADEEKVPLEKEVEYLQSYIDLQQQRFGKNVTVNFVTELEDRPYDIEPMLLIPFVENAFKHGTGMIEQAQIEIELRAKNNILQFSVRNKYNPASEEIKDKTSGIGLTNVKRRLNLLYGGNHSLLITDKESWYIISLQLNFH
jgi:two-component system, LytTR family, sensor kinase